MKTQVTIKKKLTVKTARASGGSAGQGPAAPAPVVDDAAQAQNGSPADQDAKLDVQQPVQAPDVQFNGAMPSALPAAQARSNATLFAMLALASVIMCIALLVVQWVEFSFYANPPSAWPRISP